VFKWIKYFLTGRKQRVKLNQNSCSDWADISAGVPQGTKLGPWLFIIMISDLKFNDSNIWKFVGDTTLDEFVRKNEESKVQTLIRSNALILQIHPSTDVSSRAPEIYYNSIIIL
jgi:hypothetical protein